MRGLEPNSLIEVSAYGGLSMVAKSDVNPLGGRDSVSNPSGEVTALLRPSS